MIRWYDYVVVFILADIISAAAMMGDLLSLVLGLLMYFSYEDYRRAQHNH